MRSVLQAAITFIVPLMAIAGTCQAGEFGHADVPKKEGNYVQAYEDKGVKWVELATVDADGRSRIAKGRIVKFDQDADLSKRLTEVTADFGPCGRGKIMQPDYAMTNVYFEGFENGGGECEIQNPPSIFQRIAR